MDAIRNFVDTLGIQPVHFDYLIYIVIAVGLIWSAARLYRDLTGPPVDDVEPIRISFNKKDKSE